MQPTTLLVGCGRVGSRLGLRLVDRGESVVAVRRDPSSLAPAFVRLGVDLEAPPTVELPQVDRMLITLPPPAIPGGYRTALNNLIDALPAVPSRTVFVSSTRVFEGWGPDHRVTEETEPRPVTERAAALLDGENSARELFDAIIVRPAGIYGPGRGRLIDSVRNGRPIDRSRLTNRIHELDLVRAIEAILASSEPPRLLHAVDGHPAWQGAVVDHIAHRLGVAAPAGSGTGEPSGRFLDGTLLRSVLGSVRHSDYRSGYDAVISSENH
ncbi:NAD(P)-binding domain-containing protein [Brevibacterium sp. GP-SGM9]|uniref:NAD(P)-binding domain-containing protein n=1 Tax=Brevibacterium sp. GP-SGM9 TaxID=3376990 RepID=UPI0039A4254E